MPHLLGAEIGDGLLGSQHAMGEWVVAVVPLEGLFVEDPEGLIVVHGDLLEDHTAPETNPHHPLDARLGERGQDAGETPPEELFSGKSSALRVEPDDFF